MTPRPSATSSRHATSMPASVLGSTAATEPWTTGPHGNICHNRPGDADSSDGSLQGMPGSYPSNYVGPPPPAPPVASPGIAPGAYAPQGSPYSSSYPMWNHGATCMPPACRLLRTCQGMLAVAAAVPHPHQCDLWPVFACHVKAPGMHAPCMDANTVTAMGGGRACAFPLYLHQIAVQVQVIPAHDAMSGSTTNA